MNQWIWEGKLTPVKDNFTNWDKSLEGVGCSPVCLSNNNRYSSIRGTFKGQDIKTNTFVPEC